MEDREARRAKRLKEAEILKSLYPDYNPVRHDAFVMMYRDRAEKVALDRYMTYRGIKGHND